MFIVSTMLELQFFVFTAAFISTILFNFSMEFFIPTLSVNSRFN